MSTGYQIKDQSKTYFLTFQVVFWIDLFSRQIYRDVVVESLKYCQKEKGLEIFAWVIMSNHVHLLVRSSIGDLSNTIRDFKKFTAKEFIRLINDKEESRKKWMLRLFAHAAKRQNKAGAFQVWTHGNHAEEIYSNRFITEKVEYIHNNPVRAGIVDRPEDYRYSSAANYSDVTGLLDVVPVTLQIKTVS